MPVSPEIREAVRQGSWIRKMFEEGAFLKAKKGLENVFDFSLGNPYGDPPPLLALGPARLFPPTPPPTRPGRVPRPIPPGGPPPPSRRERCPREGRSPSSPTSRTGKSSI